MENLFDGKYIRDFPCYCRSKINGPQETALFNINLHHTECNFLFLYGDKQLDDADDRFDGIAQRRVTLRQNAPLSVPSVSHSWKAVTMRHVITEKRKSLSRQDRIYENREESQEDSAGTRRLNSSQRIRQSRDPTASKRSLHLPLVYSARRIWLERHNNASCRCGNKSRLAPRPPTVKLFEPTSSTHC